MDRITLRQTDGRPVGFTGELIAEVPGPEDPGKYARWHEFKLYRMESGKYVVLISFRTTAVYGGSGLKEESHDDVFVCEDADDVTSLLTGFTEDDKEDDRYDPNQYLVGFPVGVQDYEKKQERLKDQIADSYGVGVGQLLAEAGMHDDGFVEEL
ncbi:hypothetical protein [Thalassoglobus neptunius]|nr:hypothetical protein [Thalassoglobus neptunius]